MFKKNRKENFFKTQTTPKNSHFNDIIIVIYVLLFQISLIQLIQYCHTLIELMSKNEIENLKLSLCIKKWFSVCALTFVDLT